MSNLISELPDNLFKQYTQISLEEAEMLQVDELKPVDTCIIELIGDYNTLKLLLIRQEKEKERLSILYDNHHFILKDGYISDGFKSTEAKEHANNDLIQEKEEILEIEKNIQILKASIHSIEYRLRLKFHQMQIISNNRSQELLERID